MRISLATLLLACFPVFAVADALPAPEGEVLLRVDGDIRHPNVGEAAHFDRDMLRELSPREICTRTPWHRERGRFEGPLLRDVLSAAGVESDSVEVQALNDYRARIPVDELDRYDVILAMRHNGEPLPIREFGPLFVLYPFDDHPELHTEAVRFRSVWHVAEIHAL
ncbi:MAG: molybdopterin-dependent oxidoreductase [Halomonas sp.]